MSNPIMMLISSSEAVKNNIGTFENCLTFLHISKPEPSGSVTSNINKSYLLRIQIFSASFIVFTTSNS